MEKNKRWSVESYFNNSVTKSHKNKYWEIYKKNEIFQRMRKNTINNVKTQIAKSLKNICSIYEYMTLLKQSEIQIEAIPKSLFFKPTRLKSSVKNWISKSWKGPQQLSYQGCGENISSWITDGSIKRYLTFILAGS